ncbi:hypothetical protein JXD20_02225 [Candidatus Peregrinibacteria bacterium]|nr:hypothetical protein [Candidatus Peregrinibacteria bacterium]
MEHDIKILAEAITHGKTKHLIQTHVRKLAFNEETKHLVIYVDNAGPLHELEEEEGDHHLKSGLEKIYGEDITYEIKLHGEHRHERENTVPHEINQ